MVVRAAGGTGGGHGFNAPGLGGTAANSIGSLIFAGGNSLNGNAVSGSGSGGGGGATATAVGGQPYGTANRTGGNSGSGVVAPGAGSGGNAGATTVAGNNGVAPGGAGGGSGNGGTTKVAGTGANGQIVITWTDLTLPAATTQAPSSLTPTTLTANGTITDTGGGALENCDQRGFVGDVVSHGAPGNVHPDASGYSTQLWDAAGSYPTGAYSLNATSLVPGHIYIRAFTHNRAGWAYGNEVTVAVPIDAATAAYALTGTDAALRATRQLAAGAASYFLYPGDEVVLTKGTAGKTLPADAGSYDLTGSPATLIHSVPSDPGSYALTGSDATLTPSGAPAARSITAEAGAYTLTGSAVNAVGPVRAVAHNETRSFAASLTLTLPLTVPDRPNRCLVLLTTNPLEAFGYVTGVTWKGTETFESIGRIQTGSGTASVSGWLLTNPSVGAGDIVVTRSGNSAELTIAGATVYEQVHQQSPFVGANGQDRYGIQSPQGLTVFATRNGMSTSAICTPNNDTEFTTDGTRLYSLNSGGLFQGTGATDHKPSGGGGPVTHTWTFTGGPNDLAIGGFALRHVLDVPALIAEPGAYALTGSDATLDYSAVGHMPANAGAYALTGSPATLIRSKPYDPGAYTLTGHAATLTVVPAGGVKSITAESGNYDLTGSAVVFERSVSAVDGTYQLTGFDAVLTASLHITKSILAESGSYALSGSPATLVHSKPYDPGAYSLTGATADLRVSTGPKQITAESGSYTLTGSAIAIERNVESNPGTYVLTGTDATLTKGGLPGHPFINAESAAYTLTGSTATLRYGRFITAVTAAHALTGTDATLRRGRTMAASSTTYALTGTDATLRRGRVVAAAAGAYALTGPDAGLTHQTATSKSIAADPGSYTLTGSVATLRLTHTISALGTSYALTGTDATLTRQGVAAKSIIAESGSYTLTGATVGTHAGRRIAADSGAMTLSGPAAPVTAQRRVLADSGSFALTGREVGFSVSSPGQHPMPALPGVHALTGSPATLRATRKLAALSESYSLTGTDASILPRRRLEAPAGTYALAGSDAGLRVTRRLAAETGVYALVGSAALLASSAELLSRPPVIFDSPVARRIFDSVTRRMVFDTERT
jgi:hypothetical protein